MNETSLLYSKIIPSLYEQGYEIIRAEQKFGEGSREVRADAVAYDKSGKPFLTVEVKYDLKGLGPHPSPVSSPVQKAFRTALVAEAPYFVITDGANYYWYYVQLKTGVPEPLDRPPIPPREDKSLMTLHDPDDVLQLFRSIRELLETQAGLTPRDAAAEVLKLLQAKASDEVRVRNGEASLLNIDPGTEPSLAFRRLQQAYWHWLPAGAQDRLSDRVPHDAWVTAIRLLQPFSLSTLNSTLLRPVFADILEQYSAKSQNAAILTPPPIARFMVEMLSIQPHSRILDIACGTGTILAAVLSYWERIGAMQRGLGGVYGVDNSPAMVQLARLNMLINGANPENIVLADALRESATLFTPELHLGSFDAVLTNPPIGVRLSDPEVLHSVSWPNTAPGNARKSEQLSEILFLMRALQYVRPGGQVAVILPDSVLNGRRGESTRHELLRSTTILAVIKLPEQVFAPNLTVPVTLVFLSKALPLYDHHVFMSEAREVNVGRRGGAALKDDLPLILNEYREYRISQRPPTAGLAWLAPQSDKLAARLDPTYARAAAEQTRLGLQGLGGPIVSLGEVAEIISPNTALAKADYVERGIPVVSAEQIKDGTIDLMGARHVEQGSGLARSKNLILQIGDILVVAVGKVGQAAIVTEPDLPAVLGRGLLLVRSKSPIFPPGVLFYILQLDRVQSQVGRAVTGASIPTTHARDLATLVLPQIPPESLARLSANLERANRLRTELRKLEQETLRELDSIVGVEV